MLHRFHDLTARWFERRFARPTPVQLAAWPVIEAGRDVLITAPTGSGKTLAAFLWCLDRLVRTSYEAGGLPDRVDALYVSPLKALSNDVQVNLERPVAELGEVAAELGLAPPAIRTMVRTGDTPAPVRQAAAKRPPHVLVTTPESLFILLTSESGRRALADVRTVVIDEIHATLADKRGAHLALSLERLERLVTSSGAPRPQRVGLSATVRPMDVAARWLVGTDRPEPVIVDVGQRRDLDLAIEVPDDELGAAITHEQWELVYDRVAALAREHRSTLVFANTRRLVERIAHHLGPRLGEGCVAAHHGSLSRARRHEAEKRLKAGELRVVVATASLELGIDVGAVDLVCLIGSPRAVGTAMQRVGRSGHVLGATPKGRLFPLTRDQLVECAAVVRAARRGQLDATALRDAPLDVLAQQIVATGACEDLGEDDLFALVRGGAPYASLDRRDFDSIVSVLAEGIAARRGRAGALVHRDAVNRRIRGRRAARLTAITSGGAIPDNADYDVVLHADGTKVGTLHEDFAIESMAGDVFLLGTTSWRIRRVAAGKVFVDDAAGAPPTIPFWIGEAPARSTELSAEVGALREEVLRRSAADAAGEDAVAWLVREAGLDEKGAELVRDYLVAGRAALGAVPTQTTIVAERFFDEAGGMQLVLHAPFGGRINRAWGMALRKRFCRMFDFELQAAATDDGVLLSLGPQHSFPLEAVFEMLDPEGVEELLVQAALQAPMFQTRWRWALSRALLLLRRQHGRKVPAPLQRMRADDLLAAVFPAQTACQDNHGGGFLPPHVEVPDHPIVREAIRDCLVEYMDAEGLRRVLTDMRAGRIRTVARETPEPSVLSHEILNANPYAFLDDAPLEERRARAVQLRRGLPAEVVERIGGLDADAIAAVVDEVQPDVRDADELSALLCDLGAMPAAFGERAGLEPFFDELVRTRRATRLVGAWSTGAVWVPAERRALAAVVWPGGREEPPLDFPAPALDGDEARAQLVRAWLGLTGPVTVPALAERLGLDPALVEIAVAALEGEGTALRGRFSPDLPEGQIEWCDRRLLARIHKRTVDRLRQAIEPATAADLVRFLLSWQCVRPGSKLSGRPGLSRVLAQLSGFELAAGAWEAAVLPARMIRYEPTWLDELCLSGEVAWGRLAPREASSGATRGRAGSRATPVSIFRREDMPWLFATPGAHAADAVSRERSERRGEAEGRAESGIAMSHPARDVLGYLTSAGASFLDEIVTGSRRLRSEVEDALAELVAAGVVTGDGFAGLRALVLTPASKRARGPHWRRGRLAVPVATGRWSILRRAGIELPADELAERAARQLVRRWGIVFRDLVAREAMDIPWRDLLRALRRLEMRGELRGGRIVAGFVGEQFADPAGLDALRAVRREQPRGEVVRISACDPLNVAGLITPGPRVAATIGNFVHYRDGVVVAPDDARGAAVVH